MGLSNGSTIGSQSKVVMEEEANQSQPSDTPSDLTSSDKKDSGSKKKYPRTLEVQVRTNGRTETRTRTLSIPSTGGGGGSRSPLASPKVVHHPLPDLQNVTPRIDNKLRRKINLDFVDPGSGGGGGESSGRKHQPAAVGCSRSPNLKGIKPRIDNNKHGPSLVGGSQSHRSPRPRKISFGLPDIANVTPKVDNKGLIPMNVIEHVFDEDCSISSSDDQVVAREEEAAEQQKEIVKEL